MNSEGLCCVHPQKNISPRTGKTGIAICLQREVELFLQDLSLSTDGTNIMMDSGLEIPAHKSSRGPSIIA